MFDFFIDNDMNSHNQYRFSFENLWTKKNLYQSLMIITNSHAGRDDNERSPPHGDKT